MTVWAVVPVKPFALAKQRLAGVLAPGGRAQLARLMLHDTLDALRGVRGLGGCLVVTADEAAAALARRCGAAVLHEATPAGLNAAVARAAPAVAARGGHAMLVLPGDVPGACAAELTLLIEGHEAAAAGRGALSVVPAHDGDGTNAWLLSPPGALAPCFGPRSCARHLRAARAAGLALHTLRLPGVGLDLDRAADLARFVAEPRHAATRTACFLAGATRRAAGRPALQNL